MSEDRRLRLPKVGLRVVKTVAAATIVSILYGLWGRNACFACIGAVYGMGATFQSGKQSGGNRFIGTLIGGLIVIPTYYLYFSQPFGIPNWVFLAIGLFLVLYVSQVFHAYGGIQPGSVVFFVVLCTVSQDRFVSYTIARIIDTGVGVLFALLVNTVFPSPLDKKVPEMVAEAGASVQEEIDA